MVWLGVDLGEARVGLALSDPELSLAHPAGNIQVGGDSFRALDQVIDLIEEHAVESVVIGLPLLLDGSEGKSAKKARRWAANLHKRLVRALASDDYDIQELPHIGLEDERLTTVSAHQQLHEASLSSRRHRPVVDQQSAVLILQTALDRHATQRGPING
ncbi:Holliday junction resolvase RuvX [Bifidobacterium aemilianum]|uniref:Putative pre-16S rRNA nuclease n=1 Tax=Bifidobacterium aemilianum TaxID=2493120 RepID=A0A366KAG0_9BIFI|nr:Holliday junction resolvase RuvX [Bifidobacterium aemilianum]RBP98337.1 Holliday junction resolvase RuvX [Bifidobacterium aemilianum]